MGNPTSNASYARDMRSYPGYASAFDGNAARDLAYAEPARAPRPRVDERPGLDVVTGAGRQADQEVSPAFTHVVKLFCVLVALFCVLGGARVVLAGMTTANLNQNAKVQTSLEELRTESSKLEVMRSAYGSKSRIRDLAASMLGMVDGTADGVTIDLSETATGTAGQATTGAATATAAE